MAINVNIQSQIQEFLNLAAFPATGSVKTIYVAKDTNLLYRWTGTTYTQVSAQTATLWGSISGALENQTDLQSALDDKVDVEAGKGLSTNDYTNTEKSKLAGIQAGAEVNVNADWNATSGDAQILNKPDLSTYATDSELAAGLATKENVITSATTSDYFRGDKTFQPLNKSAVGLGNVDNTSDANKPISSATQTALDTKQNTLVSGTNIKTIEGQSILGSGNIDLSKSDVGLGNVDNTSDADKPISTATQTALDGKENTITAGTTSQYFRGDKTFQTLDKSAVGLGNVDNTSDANKPVSTATQTALNAKQNTLTLTTTGTSGAATLVGSTLNIPQYSGGGGSGLVGIHNIYNNFPAAAFGTDASINASGTTNVGVPANSIITYPFTPNKTITSSQIRMNVTSLGAGLSRILIYSDNNGFPNSKLYESTDINVSTNGVKTITTTQTFNAGTTYWLSYHTNINHSISAIPAASLIPLMTSNIASSSITFYTLPATFGSAPTTFTYSGANAGAAPRMLIIP